MLVALGDAHTAGVGAQQTGGEGHQRSLAGAVGTDQAGDDAVTHREIGAAQGVDGAGADVKTLVDPFEDDGVVALAGHQRPPQLFAVAAPCG